MLRNRKARRYRGRQSIQIRFGFRCIHCVLLRGVGVGFVGVVGAGVVCHGGVDDVVRDALLQTRIHHEKARFARATKTTWKGCDGIVVDGVECE